MFNLGQRPAMAVRPSLAAIPVAITIAVAACAPARMGAPVPQPFPSPPGPVIDTGSEAPPDSTARRSGTDFPRYLEIVEQVETGGDCSARPAGSSAIGCYQMTRAALIDAGLQDAAGHWLDNAWGITSDDEFQTNRRAQDTAMLGYTTKNWLRLEPCVRDLIGTTVGGVALDQAALVAGAHLLGATGLVRFLRCGLEARCIAPETAARNGGGHNLRKSAVRRMHAVHGLSVLASTAGSGSSCGLRASERSHEGLLVLAQDRDGAAPPPLR